MLGLRKDVKTQACADRAKPKKKWRREKDVELADPTGDEGQHKNETEAFPEG